MSKLYYRIDEEHAELMEELLEENKISYDKFDNPLKALCDEELKKLYDSMDTMIDDFVDYENIFFGDLSKTAKNIGTMIKNKLLY